jgi:hypothetical protein
VTQSGSRSPARPGEAVEAQEWGPAAASLAKSSLRRGQELSRPHTGGGVGTAFGPTARAWTAVRWEACVWQTLRGWAGRRYHLGSNKEVFDAETYAIYQAPRARSTDVGTAIPWYGVRGLYGRHRQGEDRHYRPRLALSHRHHGGLRQSPREGQRVTIRWVPAHHGVPSERDSGRLTPRPRLRGALHATTYPTSTGQPLPHDQSNH